MSQTLKSLFHSSSGINRSTSTQSSMEVTPDITPLASIRVVGIGGGGGNAVNRMISAKVEGVEFVSIIRSLDTQICFELRNSHFEISRSHLREPSPPAVEKRFIRFLRTCYVATFR